MRLFAFVAIILPLTAAVSAEPKSAPLSVLAGQARTISRPSLSGTWTPVDPQVSDRMFSVGLSEIPGGTKLIIDQQVDRLTVTITLPDDKLGLLLRLGHGRFYSTVVYGAAEGRIGGYGAAGAPTLTAPTWFGDRFVVPDAMPISFRPVTMTYSLQGDLLQVETAVTIDAAHVNRVTQLLKRAP